MNELKAQSGSDATTSIVVSFAKQSILPIKSGQVKRVFRKRGPSSLEADWIYVYAASPACALIGRFPVESIEKLTVQKCLSMHEEGGISERELRGYAFGYEKLFVYSVGDFESFETELSWSDLSDKYGFSAPQSFFFLSESGKKAVDMAANAKGKK